jgi:hypothetical protein
MYALEYVNIYVRMNTACSQDTRPPAVYGLFARIRGCRPSTIARHLYVCTYEYDLFAEIRGRGPSTVGIRALVLGRKLYWSAYACLLSIAQLVK